MQHDLKVVLALNSLFWGNNNGINLDEYKDLKIARLPFYLLFIIAADIKI